MTEQTVTINGVAYAWNALTETAKIQLANIQRVDQELAQLQQQSAIFQTARNAYVQALITEVEAANKPATRKTRTKKSTD